VGGGEGLAEGSLLHSLTLHEHFQTRRRESRDPHMGRGGEERGEGGGGAKETAVYRLSKPPLPPPRAFGLFRRESPRE